MSKTIAIAGASDLAKYIVEELLKEKKHKVVILSRAVRDWFEGRVEIRITDYTAPSILNAIHDADILVSLLHDNTSFFVDAHLAMLEACKRSPRCKKFIPSECGGDIDTHPDHPRFYIPTHGVVRAALRAQGEIDYVLVNGGWFMDYFLRGEQSYMKRLPVVWPLDVDAKTVRVPGDGKAPLSLTSARDMAKAFVKLFNLEKWDDKHIYVSGETTTWNDIISLIERLKGIKLQVTKRPLDSIEKDAEKHKNDTDTKDLWLAYMDLWNAVGAAAVPADKVQEQRKKYFADVKFRSIEELIRDGDENPRVVV